MNDKNLISLADRPIEERREIARKGGIASGKARREKSRFLKRMRVQMARLAIEEILDSFEADLDELLEFDDLDV